MTIGRDDVHGVDVLRPTMRAAERGGKNLRRETFATRDEEVAGAGLVGLAKPQGS